MSVTNEQQLRPLVIETAMSGVITNAGGEQLNTQSIVDEAKACIAAGSGIVHAHHDLSLGLDAAIEQCIAINQGILAEHPDALLYPAYMSGFEFEEQHRHIRPMFEAGVLTMFGFDPGRKNGGRADENGLLTKSVTTGATFQDATAMIEQSHEFGVPCSLGIFEPGGLRWVKSLGQAGKFVPGTVVKFYFAGNASWGAKGVGPTWGLPPTKEALEIYLSLIEGSGLPWMVSVLGGSILDTDLVQYAIENGGHVRVGIEDPLRDTGVSNVEMIQRVISMAHAAGRPVASSREALAVLSESTISQLEALASIS